MAIRRDFLKKTFAAATIGSIFPLGINARAAKLADALTELNESTPLSARSNEDLWNQVRLAYTIDPTLINLNNGGVSPQPKIVQDAVDRYYHQSNEAPSYYMWRVIDKNREALREKLAHLAGVGADSIAINRNTTEALDTAIFGMPLEAGDEVVVCNFDYPNMRNAWRQREMRDGIVLKWVNLKLPIEDPNELVNAYVNQFTRKTKVVHITHLINWTGQVVPAKEICAEAKRRGIRTVVDGAHSFAHLDYKISDFDCDYFGTSLHKWLCAPFGTGLLYVRPERIAETWPMFPSDDPKSESIIKFENLGTRSFANEMAISHAIDFHLAIGSKKKEARLRYLKDYWVNQVKDLERVVINTPTSEGMYGALANIEVVGAKAADLDRHFMRDYRIHTVPIVWEGINGVRVTPHVYTKTSELDKLVKAIHDFVV